MAASARYCRSALAPFRSNKPLQPSNKLTTARFTYRRTIRLRPEPLPCMSTGLIISKASKWYRSQVTNAQLNAAKTGTTAKGQPIINYEATFANTDPVLNMFKAGEIIYSDLNAIVTDFAPQNDNCFANGGTNRTDPPSGTCGRSGENT